MSLLLFFLVDYASSSERKGFFASRQQIPESDMFMAPVVYYKCNAPRRGAPRRAVPRSAALWSKLSSTQPRRARWIAWRGVEANM